MFSMPSVPRRYGERPARNASSCLANTSSRTRRRFRPSLPKMLAFDVALAFPFASTVAISPPHVMIGTCVGPGATAPTAVVTVCASGGDWMNCPCASAPAAKQASAAAAARCDRAVMALLARLSLDELSAPDEHLAVPVGADLAARNRERAPGVVAGAVLRAFRLDVVAGSAELAFALH